MPRFTNILIVILATSLYTRNLGLVGRLQYLSVPGAIYLPYPLS